MEETLGRLLPGAKPTRDVSKREKHNTLDGTSWPSPHYAHGNAHHRLIMLQETFSIAVNNVARQHLLQENIN